MVLNNIFNNFHYFVSLSLFLVGFYTLLTKSNLIKKMIGLNIMDTSIFLFLVSTGYIQGGKAPIIDQAAENATYVNPIPQALVLTGIVVSFSISVFAFALIIKLYKYYGTLNAKKIMKMRGN